MSDHEHDGIDYSDLEHQSVSLSLNSPSRFTLLLSIPVVTHPVERVIAHTHTRLYTQGPHG
jgi:hypothetical protein